MDASKIRIVCIRLGYVGLIVSLLLALVVGWTRDTWSPYLRQRLVVVAIGLLLLPIVSVLVGLVWRGPAKGKPRQLTLRTLFVEVTLFVVAGACLANLWFSVIEDMMVAHEIDRVRGYRTVTIDPHSESSGYERPAIVRIRALPHVKNLQHLYIHHQSIDSFLLKNIAGSRRLVTLEITDCNLSDDDLVHLAKLHDLVKLDLSLIHI